MTAVRNPGGASACRGQQGGQRVHTLGGGKGERLSTRESRAAAAWCPRTSGKTKRKHCDERVPNSAVAMRADSESLWCNRALPPASASCHVALAPDHEQNLVQAGNKRLAAEPEH
jgi:hypothetical protein